MENVTDRTHNPFGIRPPCDTECPGAPAVTGYGDANADVHVVGDHPGVHGGGSTGVPFTGSEAGRRLQSVLHEVGLLGEEYADRPRVHNCFLSYLHACCPGEELPTPDDYRRLEPTFDAELRAIAAHVLVPVGDRALSHVLAEYTSRARDLPHDAAELHGREVPGSGFLVVPVGDPADWTGDDRRRIVERLRETLASDYRQVADLGHFFHGGDPYMVR